MREHLTLLGMANISKQNEFLRMLVRIQRKGNSCNLLLGMNTNIAIRGNGMDTCQKTKKIAIPSNFKGDEMGILCHALSWLVLPFTAVKIQKQLRNPMTNEGIKKI